jgi:hypothetical protein
MGLLTTFDIVYLAAFVALVVVAAVILRLSGLLRSRPHGQHSPIVEPPKNETV